jgi:hypothetical protein
LDNIPNDPKKKEQNPVNDSAQKISLRKIYTLLLFRIDLKIIQEKEKDFFWKRPSCCPGCGSKRLWGHGFVLRYFFGSVFGIWMKRWRCPDCRAVHTARPVRYTPGVQYPRDLQIKSLMAKLSGNPFLKHIPRQVQQHWRKIFFRILHKTGNWTDPVSFLHSQLQSRQLWLIKRTIHCETWTSGAAPYLTLALTTKERPFKLE